MAAPKRDTLQPGASGQRQASPDRKAGANRQSPGRAVAVAGSPVGPAATSDDVLHSAFEHSPSGISVSALDGRWLRVNAAYCAMLGYQLAELLDVTHREVTHRDDVLADREFAADALAGRRDSVQHEKRYIRKDGSVVWALTRVKLIRDRTGSPSHFVSHVQDLSDRRATLGLLHGSERTLRAVIDHTPAIIFVLGRDHRYRLVNRQFEKAFGVSSDWIVGRPDTDLLPPSTIAASRAKDQLVLDGSPAAPRSRRSRSTVSRGCC